MNSPIQGVLFDLDGTLLDTAPDMGAALNELRAEHGLASLAQASIRPHVSKGGAALVKLGLGVAQPPEQASRLQRFLALYRERLVNETRPFEEVPALLDEIERRGLRWGVVTNKIGALTMPLLEALGFAARAGIIVCGDTLPERKPSPMPLLHAARHIDVPPAACVFVGDAECDMQAADAAGMIAIGARFGYIAAEDSPERWPARGWIDSPLELLHWI